MGSPSPTTWQDSSDRTCDSSIKFSDCMRLKKAGFDLLGSEASKHVEEFFRDIFRQLGVVAELHRPQFEKVGLSKEEFMDLLVEVPGRFEQVQDAFIEAIVLFTANIGKDAVGKLISKALVKVRAAESKAVEKINSKEFSESIDRQIEAELSKFDQALANFAQ